MTTFRTSLLIVLLFAGSTLRAQTTSSDTAPSDPMAPLSWMVGQWEGTGWAMDQSRQRVNIRQTEDIRFMVDGEVICVEGHGTDTEGNTIHHAAAMIHYNPAEERYDFRSYAHGMGGGNWPMTQLEENVFRWEIKTEQVYIRYTITHNEADQWHEFGEVYVAQADSWFPMFEMTLDRVAEAN